METHEGKCLQTLECQLHAKSIYSVSSIKIDAVKKTASGKLNSEPPRSHVIEKRFNSFVPLCKYCLKQEVFNWVSKVICLGFCLLYSLSLIG